MAIKKMNMKATVTRYIKNQLGLICLLLMVNNAMAQPGEKKIYRSELDSLWSKDIYANHISNDGKWLAIDEVFDYKSNVLTLKSISDSISFKFQESQWVKFSENNRWFGCITLGNELHIVDLEKKIKSSYLDMQSYSFSNSGDYIAGIEKQDNKEALRIINLENKETSMLEGVKKYSWQPNKNRLLLTLEHEGKKTILLYDVLTQKKEIIYSSKESNYYQIKWSGSGNSIVFLEQSSLGSFLHFYHPKSGLKTIDNLILQKQFPEYKISDKDVYVSDDGKKIFFYRQVKNSGVNDSESMEVWNSNDAWIYPRMKDFETRERQHLLTVWFTDTDTIIAIETEEKPTSALRINNKNAIVFNKLQ